MFILKSVVPCEAQIITYNQKTSMLWCPGHLNHQQNSRLRFLWLKEFEEVEGLNQMVSFRDQSYL